jgi:hypothetical protein
MPAPIILISNQRLKPGQFEAYKARYANAVQRFLASRPGTLAHSAYLSENGTDVSVVIAFADVDAMEAHMLGLGSSPQKAQESMDFVSIEIYGAPSAATLAAIQNMVGKGVPLSIRPRVIDGYIRAGNPRE